MLADKIEIARTAEQSSLHTTTFGVLQLRGGEREVTTVLDRWPGRCRGMSEVSHHRLYLLGSEMFEAD